MRLSIPTKAALVFAMAMIARVSPPTESAAATPVDWCNSWRCVTLSPPASCDEESIIIFCNSVCPDWWVAYCDPAPPSPPCGPGESWVSCNNY
jgi:hypothetical protein